MDNKYFGLQLFTDVYGGGQLVNRANAEYPYANAYTGATIAATGTDTLADTIKDYYETELLDNTRIKQVYGQFAKKVPLPLKHAGAIEWRKWETLDKADELVEGVIPTGQKMGMTKVTATIKQYGTYVAVSDRLELRGFDDVILGATEELADSYNRTQEDLITAALATGTNVLYCDNLTATGVYVNTPTGCTGMGVDATVGGVSGTATYAYLTPKMVAKAVTKMKKAKVKTIGGKFVCVLHPSVAEDLRNNSDWKDFHQYDATAEIFNGEIGELHGVRFVEDPDAPVWGATAANKDAKGNKTYPCYFFGAEAFGIVDPAGGNMQMIVHNRSEIGGPLNQFSTIGYKFETGEKILYPERVLRVMAMSTYGGTDTATGTD